MEELKIEQLEEIKEQARDAVLEILEQAKLEKGDIFLIGCSTSEVAGIHIGKGSSMKVAETLYEAVMPILKERGIELAVQCCEHLNRSVIIEKRAVKPWEEIVNVVPKINAGSAFATVAYEKFDHAVAMETVKADAGMDIGDTLIGMHLRHVAVPLRIKVKEIGHAHVTSARTRPKFVGGGRASYDDVLSGGDIKR